MRRTLIILPFVMFFTSHCTESELRERTGGGGNGSLNQADYDRIRDINVAMSDAQQAVVVAFPNYSVQGEAASLAVSEKVAKMAEALKTCPAPKGRPQEEKFNQNWSVDQEIEGKACPIRLIRRMNYRISRDLRALDLFYFFRVEDPEFAKLNALTEHRGGGRITFSRNRKKEDLFTGTLEYPGIQVSGVGSVNVKIYLSSSHMRGTSTGNMTIQFKAPAFNYQAGYNWSLQNDSESFYLNGKLIESTEFLDMFSAFDVPGMKRRILEEIRTPR